MPREALTPEGLERALNRYVEFGESDTEDSIARAGGIAGLRKGLSLEEVEQLLGPAATAAESDECALRVMTRTYRGNGQRTVARFVSGVLVEYTVTPE